MPDKLIHDRGRGPEIVGTRITVYNLLPDFLDPTATESAICRMYDLTAEQVAAARAYVLQHADTVLARHLEIEERMSAGNPPEVTERARQTHATFMKFRDWLRRREAEEQDRVEAGETGSGRFPSFREWLAEQEGQPVKVS
jgi:uncharacterized protein (DUF433 family)